MSNHRRISRREFVLASAAATAAGALGFPATLRAQARPIKIGLVHPVTGFLAFSGQQSRVGAQMAIDEINAAGGIKSMGGAKLEAMLGDAQSKPEVGVSVVEKMHEDGAVAFIGCFSSAIGLAATQAAAKYNTPFVIDVGVSDNLTARGLKNVFRLSPSHSRCVSDGITALNDINKAAGSPAKSAVLVHEESEFGTVTAKTISEKMPGIGIEVKEVIRHANPTRNFDNVALRIRSLKPDLVVISNYQNEYVLLARTLHQQKIELAAVYSVLGGGYNDRLVKENADVAQYMMDVNQWWNPRHAKGIDMKKRVEAKGNFFTFEVYCSYNAIKCLADAYERAGSADREKVIDALNKSTWSDHFMPYGPTKFVNGQNEGGRTATLQILNNQIQVVHPSAFAEAKAVFPRPKQS